MRHISEIMKELGFSADAPTSTQAAFVKHLIKKAYGVDVEIPESLQEKIRHEEQQSFTFGSDEKEIA